MSAFNRTLIDKLFNVCNQTHEVWVLRRALFDDNNQQQDLGTGHHVYFLNMLSEVLHEYMLLQLAKLHDPAVGAGRINLSIAYIVEYGGWDVVTADRLRALKSQLDSLNAQIRPARNRILAHNDLATLLSDEPLGGFPPNADIEYFITLHAFVSLVYEKVTGAPCADFSSFSRTDAEGLILALLASDAGRHG
jgi:hypothetical protein